MEVGVDRIGPGGSERHMTKWMLQNDPRLYRRLITWTDVAKRTISLMLIAEPNFLAMLKQGNNASRMQIDG